MSLEIKDTKDRIIVTVNDKKKIAFARYPDMDEKCKSYLIKICKELTDNDPEELRKFLNYEETKDEFCT